MQLDRDNDENDENDINLLLVMGYIKEQSSVNLKLITFNNIVDMIILFLPEQLYTDLNQITIPSPMEIIEEEKQIITSDPIESTILLIDGFIRQHSTQSNIPPIAAIINDLIKQFYQRMKGTLFVWNITNKKSRLLSQILSTKTDEISSFESDIFTIQPTLEYFKKRTQQICGHCNTQNITKMNICTYCNDIKHLSLKYYLKLFPTGVDNSNRNNEMQLQIVLVSLPSIIKTVSFIYQIYCPQLQLYWSAQRKYTCDVLTSKCTNNWSSNAMSDDITHLYNLHQINSLTFLCKLDIINISNAPRFSSWGSNDNNSPQSQRKSKTKSVNMNLFKCNPTYYFDAKKYLTQNNAFKFKWCIHNDALNHFKHSKLNNKSMISDIYYNMWSISVRHRNIELIDRIFEETRSRNVSISISNSFELEFKEQAHALSVAVQLCVLPPNISKILAHIKLVCPQSTIKWSTVQTFTKENEMYAPNGDIIIKDKYIDLQQLTIIANITIIEAYDINGNEMSLNHELEDKKLIICKPFSTMTYKFEPVIQGDLSMRYAYQNICVTNNDKFDEISVDELQAYDRVNHPESFRLKINNIESWWPNNNNKGKKNNDVGFSYLLHINKEQKSNNNPWICGKSNSNNTNVTNNTNVNTKYTERIGTKGYKFKPFKDRNPSSKHKRCYYQHICIESKAYKNKSSEELRFEDQNSSYNYNASNPSNAAAARCKSLGLLANSKRWERKKRHDNNTNNRSWSWGKNNNNNNNKDNNNNDNNNNDNNNNDNNNNNSNTNPMNNNNDMWSFGFTNDTNDTNDSNDASITWDWSHWLTTNNNNNNTSNTSHTNEETLSKYRKLYASYFKDLYLKYAPEKVGNIDNLMDKYSKSQQQLQQLYERLIKKYKVNENDIKPIISDKDIKNMQFDENDNIITNNEKNEKSEIKMDHTLEKIEKNIESEIASNDCKTETKETKESKEVETDMFSKWYWERIGIKKYYGLFVENGLNDLDILDKLTDKHLHEIGVNKMGDRIKILKQIEKSQVKPEKTNVISKEKIIIVLLMLQFVAWVGFLLSRL